MNTSEGSVASGLLDPLELAGGSFAFCVGEEAPVVSSGRKEVYRGTFVGADGQERDAMAAFFDPAAADAFGTECSTLAVGAQIGVGPGLFAASVAPRPSDGVPCPLLVEGDAGERLSEVLANSEVRGGGREVVLEPPDSELGHRQASKILFDVMCELANLHAAGLCHRDVKSANVGVRVIGPEPWDLRATLIDFELAARPGAPAAPVRTDLCHRRLFSRLVGEPTARELDLGCLALVACELREGRPLELVTDQELRPYLTGRLRFFRWLEDGGMVFASHIDPAVDLAPLARECDLARVPGLDVEGLVSFSRHFGYVDAEELRALASRPDVALVRRRGRIARVLYERYVRQCLDDGREVLFWRFEDQPQDLQDSNYQEAVDIVRKLGLLGYEVVEAGAIPAEERLRSLSEDEVERMAAMEHARWVQERLAAGWKLAPERNVERKESPYLVPYDELSERMKEYDREPARATVELLELAGLWARRAG